MQDRAALESMRADFEAQLHTARSEVAKAQVSPPLPAATAAASVLHRGDRTWGRVGASMRAIFVNVLPRQAYKQVCLR